jgi:hypothetical protein
MTTLASGSGTSLDASSAGKMGTACTSGSVVGATSHMYARIYPSTLLHPLNTGTQIGSHPRYARFWGQRTIFNLTWQKYWKLSDWISPQICTLLGAKDYFQSDMAEILELSDWISPQICTLLGAKDYFQSDMAEILELSDWISPRICTLLGAKDYFQSDMAAVCCERKALIVYC